MTFATRETEMLGRVRDRFGRSVTLTNVTGGTYSGTTGKRTGASTATATLLAWETPADQTAQAAGEGRPLVDRRTYRVLAADCDDDVSGTAFTPTAKTATVTDGTESWRVAVVTRENSGKVFVLECEKIA